MINGKKNISKKELFALALTGADITLTVPKYIKVNYDHADYDINLEFRAYVAKEYKKLHDAGIVFVEKEDDCWVITYRNSLIEENPLGSKSYWDVGDEDFVDSDVWIASFDEVFCETN